MPGNRLGPLHVGLMWTTDPVDRSADTLTPRKIGMPPAREPMGMTGGVEHVNGGT